MSHHPQANNFFDSSVRLMLAFCAGRAIYVVKAVTPLYAFSIISFYAEDICFSRVVNDTLAIGNFSTENFNKENLINLSLSKIIQASKPNFSV